jgi:hypothetical protein
MLKIGWGSPTLITVSLGIVIELPSPVRIAILGRLHMALPDEKKATIVINLDVLGTLDFEKSLLTIDAALYDSRIAMFTVTGAMALRLSWGADPVFVLSVGGFNPRFQPPPEFPSLPRMGLSMGKPEFGLRFESYFALTTNTLQFGSRLDAWAKKDWGGLIGTVEGKAFMAFDALMQFTPFSLIADLEGSIAIKAGIIAVAGGLKLTLNGPKPWHAVGCAFADLGALGKPRIPLDITIGEPEPEPPPPPVDVMPLLLEALSQPGNWSAQLPDDGSMLVTLRASKPGEDQPKENELLVHPFGKLAVRQRVVPLDTTIQRYGYSPIIGEPLFTIKSVYFGTGELKPTELAGAEARETFARGQFFDQTDDEKLSQPQFEELPAGRSGIGIEANAIKVGSLVPDESDAYETVVFDADERDVPQEKYSIPLEVLQVAIGLGAAAQSPMRQSASDKFAGPTSRSVRVKTPAYAVVGTETVLSEDDEPKTYASYTEARAALKTQGNDADRQIVEVKAK